MTLSSYAFGFETLSMSDTSTLTLKHPAAGLENNPSTVDGQ